MLWDIDAARRRQAEDALRQPGRVRTSIVELSAEADTAAATHDTVTPHGRIDILVNNAGRTGGNAPTWALAPEVRRRVTEVNRVGRFAPAALWCLR